MNTLVKTHITFVKKIMLDGSLCGKCVEVTERLDRDGLLDQINYIAVADSNNLDSEGMLLAQKYKVERAPFFIVEEPNGDVQIFDVYFKFKRFFEKNIGLKAPIVEVV